MFGIWRSNIIYVFSNAAKATFQAVSKTYSYLTPDMWKETVFVKSPFQEFTDHLSKTYKPVQPAAAPQQAF